MNECNNNIGQLNVPVTFDESISSKENDKGSLQWKKN